MNETEQCIKELTEVYPDIECPPRTCSDDVLEQIPAPLREFYRLYDAADFPFGNILPAEIATRNDTEKVYFDSMGWFSFGSDNYFSFWLCRYEPDEEGLWLVSWDHDSGTEIEAVYADLPAFLKGMAKEYEEMAAYED